MHIPAYTNEHVKAIRAGQTSHKVVGDLMKRACSQLPTAAYNKSFTMDVSRQVTPGHKS